MQQRTKEVLRALAIALCIVGPVIIGGIVSVAAYHVIALLAGAGGTMVAVRFTFRRLDGSPVYDSDGGRALLQLRNIFSFVVAWLLALSVLFANSFLFGVVCGIGLALGTSGYVLAPTLRVACTRICQA